MALIGMDGAGKTTQARLLTDWLASRAVVAGYWRNAGGRLWFGRLARRLGLADAEALLGRRGMLLVEAVLRWLAIASALGCSMVSRRVAVMDRYAYCQYASIRARTGQRERLVRWAFGVFPAPTVVCYLAIPPEQARSRIGARGDDDEDLDHLIAVDAAYRALPEARIFV
ncbi:MAG: thymidylate kinase, partial [Micromonosporaceae bacterium]|nr:thymidylate kinase [Micromonosporaceae bacterium]